MNQECEHEEREYKKDSLHFIPDSIYHSDQFQGYSRSQIAKVLDNPMDFDRPRKVSPAMTLGSAFHKKVLEAQDFHNEYHVMPERPNGLKLTTKEGKAWKARSVEGAEGKDIISFDDNQMLVNMVNNLEKLPYFQAVRDSKPFYEVSVRTECKEAPELNLKAKADIVDMENGFIYDVKTIRDNCSSKNIINAVRSSYLNLQAYLYTYIFTKAFNKHFDFVFIFVEKTKHIPDIRVIHAGPEMLIGGQYFFTEGLKVIKDIEAYKNGGNLPFRNEGKVSEAILMRHIFDEANE